MKKQARWQWQHDTVEYWPGEVRECWKAVDKSVLLVESQGEWLIYMDTFICEDFLKERDGYFTDAEEAKRWCERS